MKVIFAFIFYYTYFITFLTICLVIFIVPPARHLLYKLRKIYKHFIENQIVKYGLYLIFIVTMLIFIESFFTYSAIKDHFTLIQKYDPWTVGRDALKGLSSQRKDGYLQQLKQFREYYYAERNMMLTFSALFISFAFKRLLYNIIKYAEVQEKLSLVQAEKKQIQNKKVR